MNFSQIRWAIKAALVMTLLVVSICAFAADKKTPGDKVAAVNGVSISQVEFDRELDFFVKRVAARGQQVSESEMVKIKGEVLENIVEREVLFQESKKKGIQIKPEAISEQLKSIKARYPNEEEFSKMLGNLKMTESDIKLQIERGMAIQQLIDKEVTEKIKVTDEETKSYFDANPDMFQQPEQIKASHILIKVDTKATDAQKAEARKKINEVQKKVKKGEDFATLAKTYSEGPSAPNGGDLGYFRRNSNLVKPFKDAAFKLEVNETSDIVETQFGYHLIKVVDKQPAKKLTYAEVKDQLNEHLKKSKMSAEVNAYIIGLKKDAKIEKF